MVYYYIYTTIYILLLLIASAINVCYLCMYIGNKGVMQTDVITTIIMSLGLVSGTRRKTGLLTLLISGSVTW